MIDEKALQAAIPVGSNMANADLVRAIIEAYEAARSAEAVEDALDQARREERERCAKVAENQFCPDPDIEDACRQIAAAIRKG